jgi:hypothetical protein
MDLQALRKKLQGLVADGQRAAAPIVQPYVQQVENRLRNDVGSVGHNIINLENKVPLYGQYAQGVRDFTTPIIKNFAPNIEQTNQQLGLNHQNQNGFLGTATRFAGSQVAAAPLMLATEGVANPVTSKLASLVPKGTSLLGAAASGAAKGAIQFAPYGWMGGLDYAKTPEERMQHIYKSTLENMALGGGLHSVGSAAAQQFNAVKSNLADLLVKQHGMTPQQAEQAVVQFGRDELGRYTGKKVTLAPAKAPIGDIPNMLPDMKAPKPMSLTNSGYSAARGKLFSKSSVRSEPSYYSTLRTAIHDNLPQPGLSIKTVKHGVNAGLSDIKPTNDPATIQKLKSAIAEGEMYLKAGTKNGQKLSQDERLMIAKSVENAKAKIGAETIVHPGQSASEGYTRQVLSSDQLIDHSKGIPAEILPKDILGRWDKAVKQGRAVLFNGRFYHLKDAPEGSLQSPQLNTAQPINPLQQEGQVLPQSEQLANSSTKNIAQQSPVAQQPVSDTAISSEGVVGNGKVNTRSFPTQTEMENRAAVNAGLPDLATQRKAKLIEAGLERPEEGVGVPTSQEQGSINSFEQDVLGKPKPLQTADTLLPLKQPEIQPLETGPSPLHSLADTTPEGKVQLPEPIKQSFNEIIKDPGTDVKTKVGLLDYVRTPDRVLQKIGLGSHAKDLRSAYDQYQKELPKEIDRITQWSKRVPENENQALFRYLDGQGTLQSLSPETQKVAGELRTYLQGWAEKLQLPEDKRITSYITHIFDKGDIEQEFDPEIAALIRDKVAGSVYDPFVQKRLGKRGYVEDTWRALDAYVKRATRKVNMDPALKQIKNASENMEESQFNYVKSYIDRVNMRPTQVDNLIDNSIKQVIGYKLGQRPVTVLSHNIRQAIYRGTLGLNASSALKNLSQGANTYAKLGEKYTVIGYTDMMKNLVEGSKELEENGVLGQDIVQDRTLSATRQLSQAMDKGLFAFFEAAERINRGSAYFGAKAKFLAEHKTATEDQAISYAKKIVRDTQFTFGSIDTPPVLQADLGKLLGQFQSYNLKQGEFLAEMVRNKDLAGLVRYSGASLVFALTVGKLIGMKPQDMIPSLRIGSSPFFTLGQDVVNTVTNQKDKYGNQPTAEDRLNQFGKDAVPFVPAGVQLKKTITGLNDVSKGYQENKSGNINFPINQNPMNFIRAGLFGSNNLPEAQMHYNDDSRPLSKKQTGLVKLATDKMGAFSSIMNLRKMKADAKKGEGSGDVITTDNKITYNDNGSVHTLDLNPPTKGEGIDAFTNQDWQYSKAREVWKSNMPEDQKSAALKKLGVSSEDVRYDYLAHHTNDIKTQYITSKNMSHDQLIERLTSGRVQSISGEIFASNGVIDNLYNEGSLSKEEAAKLKAMKMDKSGNNIAKAKTTKGKKFKISFKKLSLPKVKLAKLAKVNINIKTPKNKALKISKSKPKLLKFKQLSA